MTFIYRCILPKILQKSCVLPVLIEICHYNLSAPQSWVICHPKMYIVLKYVFLQTEILYFTWAGNLERVTWSKAYIMFSRNPFWYKCLGKFSESININTIRVLWRKQFERSLSGMWFMRWINRPVCKIRKHQRIKSTFNECYKNVIDIFFHVCFFFQYLKLSS